MSGEATKRVTVLGAGAGAMCWAAHLSRLGWSVVLASRTRGALEEIAAAGSITLENGATSVDCRVEVFDDPAEAVAHSGRTVLCVPADRLGGYRDGPLSELREGQTLLIAPGNTGASMYLTRTYDFDPPFDVVELNTLPFVARRTGGAAVREFVRLRRVYWAPLRPLRDASTAAWLSAVVEGAVRVASVLQTALTNYNPIVHPPVMLLNAGRLESLGAFLWYREGSTASAGRLMRVLDEERMAIQIAFGLERVPFAAFFDEAGYSPTTPARPDIAETLRRSEANATIVGPSSLAHRFLDEDVPFGLVPLAALASRAGVASPMTEAVIALAEGITGKDYRHHGFTSQRLGLDLPSFGGRLWP
jgi:opine dehydrogenase